MGAVAGFALAILIAWRFSRPRAPRSARPPHARSPPPPSAAAARKRDEAGPSGTAGAGGRGAGEVARATGASAGISQAQQRGAGRSAGGGAFAEAEGNGGTRDGLRKDLVRQEDMPQSRLALTVRQQLNGSKRGRGSALPCASSLSSPLIPSWSGRPALTPSAIPCATLSAAISGDAGEGVAWASLGFGSPRAVPPASALGWFRRPTRPVEWNGGGRGGNGRQQDPALDRATNAFAEVVRQARASGEPTHVHIEVTNGPPFAADPGQVAPLRAPTLREYLPVREGRAQFRTPRQVPGFSAQRFSVGRTPGWPTAFPREAPTAPPPTRAGRDPMLTMCRILNLAEACQVVANLQLAVSGATRNFPSSYGPKTRGSCVSLAESLESPLAPVSEAPAGVAPLARTFPRHVGDLVGAARVGTTVDTLQSSAHLLLAVSACMRLMLEVEGTEPYTM
ncbi:unnamed protein product [Closterium sp. NIES-53]